MKDDILIDSTIKIFENGVVEINKLKSAIINLNDTVEQLTNFNEILDVQIDTNKVDDINKKLEAVISKNKETLTTFENCIETINKEYEIKSNNIELGIDVFYEDVKQISDKLHLIDFDLVSKKVEEILKSLNCFVDEVESKYNNINEKYLKMNDALLKSENILMKVDEIHNIIQNSNLDVCIVDVLKKIKQLDLKYEKINHTIQNLDENIKSANQKFEDNNLLIKSDKVLDGLEKFSENVNNEYEKIQSKYNEIDLLKENIKNEYEERIISLEKKIDLLIDENKAFKLAYSTREIEDNAFKEDVLNLIKDVVNRVNISDNYIDDDSIERLKELAKKGDINASFKLAQKYHKGEDITKNIDLAVRYYTICAKNNHEPSKNEIINIYIQEANNKNVKYQRMLGMEYLKGNLVDYDVESAIKWLTIASENGSQEAKKKLEKIRNM